MKLPSTVQSFIFHTGLFLLATIALLAAIGAGLASETTPVPEKVSDILDFLFSLKAFFTLPVLLIMLLLLAYEARKFMPATRIVFFVFNLVRGSLTGKFYFMGAGYAALAFLSGRVEWIPHLDHGVIIPLVAFALGYLVWCAAGWIFLKVARDRR
ncbi:hypothetical protein [Xanthomonas campestris]|uniref:hypothetical protein n=1 Tax=Xanthomonas campestris TaxID=339 RepID=UPI0023EA4583|nr:hypothetical protein [Xanthomonas campestris]